jgi:hypothetical protein
MVIDQPELGRCLGQFATGVTVRGLAGRECAPRGDGLHRGGWVAREHLMIKGKK